MKALIVEKYGDAVLVAEAMRLTNKRGYDRVIEASGDSKMFPLCIDMLAHFDSHVKG